MSDTKGAILGLLTLLVLGYVFFPIVKGCTMHYKNTWTKPLTVTDKGIKRASKNSDIYLIYTDKEVFKDSDSIFKRKFNSSDIYGKVKVGKTYKFKVYWFRSHFWSQYRNILEMEEYNDKSN